MAFCQAKPHPHSKSISKKYFWTAADGTVALFVSLSSPRLAWISLPWPGLSCPILGSAVGCRSVVPDIKERHTQQGPCGLLRALAITRKNNPVPLSAPSQPSLASRQHRLSPRKHHVSTGSALASTLPRPREPSQGPGRSPISPASNSSLPNSFQFRCHSERAACCESKNPFPLAFHKGITDSSTPLRYARNDMWLDDRLFDKHEFAGCGRGRIFSPTGHKISLTFRLF